MSFYTSLSGLKGAQADLSVISNNVANVGTIGFKRSRTEFGDIMASSPMQSANVTGSGTRLKGIVQQFGQGGVQSSERALDLMLSGQGFFVTKSDASGGGISFTRAGSFGTDNNGNVVDARGAFVQVMPVDEQGVVTSKSLDALRNLRIPQSSGQSQATSTIGLSASLPLTADLPAARKAFEGKTYAFDRTDPNSYNFSNSTTVFDVSGNEVPATIYYTRTDAPDATDKSSTWEARLFVGGKEVSSDPATTDPATPVTLTFDEKGVMTAPADGVTFAPVTAGDNGVPLALTIDFAGTAQASGGFTVANLTQDGFAAGELNNVSVGEDGLVVATFSNGDSKALGKLAIANFSNPSGLRQLGDAVWAITGDSGQAMLGEAGKGGLALVQSGALEVANVDITEELVALIQAQRNFQANAKAIETANAITQTIVNLQ